MFGFFECVFCSEVCPAWMLSIFCVVISGPSVSRYGRAYSGVQAMESSFAMSFESVVFPTDSCPNSVTFEL